MLITENFLTDPYRVRNLALKSDFDITSATWPGCRCNIPEPIKKELISRTELVLDEKVTLSSAYFQWMDKSWGEGICHPDLRTVEGIDLKYTSITFLNLEAPFHSGVEVYDERYYKDAYAGKIMGEFTVSTTVPFYTSNRNFISRKIFQRKVRKYNSYFKDPFVIPNKFNRNVIFTSPLIHRAQNFFGSTVLDSRLILVGLFI